AGIAKHRQIVNGDDERHLRTDRRSERRAVEHIDTPRGAEHEWVPDGVANETCSAARAAEDTLPHGEVVTLAKLPEQRVDVARRSCPGLHERRDIHADGDHSASA